MVILCFENSVQWWEQVVNNLVKLNKTNWSTAEFTANSVGASRYSGWSYAGITQFNELLSNVIPARRKATKKLEEQLKEMYVAALKDKPEKASTAGESILGTLLLACSG